MPFLGVAWMPAGFHFPFISFLASGMSSSSDSSSVRTDLADEALPPSRLRRASTSSVEEKRPHKRKRTASASPPPNPYQRKDKKTVSERVFELNKGLPPDVQAKFPKMWKVSDGT